MYFEGRELKPYAEPLGSSAELVEGIAYFTVNYVDTEMLIPVVEPMIYIGKGLEEGDNESIYFQDVDSYFDGVRYESATKDDHAIFVEYSEGELNNIFEYERALDQLMLCSLRRKE